MPVLLRSGKALYAGISSYNPEQPRRAAKILRDLGTPCLIHQPSYSMFDRWVEDGLLDVLDELVDLDTLAAARFASVFHNFQNAEDYAHFFEKLELREPQE